MKIFFWNVFGFKFEFEDLGKFLRENTIVTFPLDLTGTSR